MVVHDDLDRLRKRHSLERQLLGSATVLPSKKNKWQTSQDCVNLFTSPADKLGVSVTERPIALPPVLPRSVPCRSVNT
jgi:hypothetical protein